VSKAEQEHVKRQGGFHIGLIGVFHAQIEDTLSNAWKRYNQGWAISA